MIPKIRRKRTLEEPTGPPALVEFPKAARRSDGARLAAHPTSPRTGRPAIVAKFADLSQRAHIESALRESEARFRSYFELPLMGMATTSPDKRFLDVNDRLCQILGYSREELMRLNWAQITHPEDLAADLEQFGRLLDGDIPKYSTEKRFIRSDGRVIWTRISAACVRNDDGSVHSVCSVVGDISANKASEQAIQQASREYREIFERAPEGIFKIVLDPQTQKSRLFSINPSGARMLGYDSPEQAIASITNDKEQLWVRPQDYDTCFDLACKHGGVENRECELKRKDGTPFWAELSVRIIRAGDGTLSVHGFAVDISQRRASEENLRRAEREYKTIFDDAPEGIFKTTRDGKSIALNTAGARMLGFPSSEEAVAAIDNAATIAWFVPEERHAYARQLEATGEVRAVERRFKLRDGSPFWVAISARRVADDQGQTLYYQGFFEDINERKRLEAEDAAHVRELSIMSAMNQALLKAREEDGLLKEYCRIMVDIAGYRMAWVGFAEREPEMRVVPAAWAGAEDGYLSAIKVMWDGSALSHGITGRAIQIGEIEAAEDFLTTQGMEPFLQQATQHGYRSAIAVPFHPSDGTIACLTAYGAAPIHWSNSERKLMEQVAAALGYGVRTLRDALMKEQYQRDLRTSLEQTIQVVANTVDQRDAYTAGHQHRVADLSAKIGLRLGLDTERVHGLRLAASIHDLGKIGIPAEILSKPGALTPIQYALIQEHAQLGYDLLKNVSFPWPIAEIVRQHHERMDGSGYPQRLIGDDILLESRILAAADVVESMATHRPYRAALGVDAALNEMTLGRGTRYDQNVVDACIQLFREDGYTLPT